MPAVFINNYKTIDIQSLDKKKNLVEEKLNIKYWLNLINLNKVDSIEEIKVSHKDYEFDKKLNNILTISRIKNKLKIPKYYLSRYFNIKNYINYLKK